MKAKLQAATRQRKSQFYLFLAILITGITVLQLISSLSQNLSENHCSPCAYATTSFTSEFMWNETYGGVEDDRAFCATNTSDGNFILAGFTFSYGAGSSDGWIIKVNGEGRKIWNKTYGGPNADEFRWILQVEDALVLVGNTFSYGMGKSDGWLVKIDNLGNIIWNKTYGGSDVDKIFCATYTQDGGFILAGFTFSYGNSGSDGWLVKVNGDGDIIWNKTYGGLSTDAFRAIVNTEDGGYVTVGYTNSTGQGMSDIWIVKVDEQGNVLWEKTYGGKKGDGAYSLVQVKDGYVIVGYSSSSDEKGVDAWIIRTDTSGEIVWNKTYGESNWDLANAVIKTDDGGYAFVGYTFSFGNGGRDVWLVKVDSNGNLQWNNAYGGEDMDEAYSLIQTSRNSYVLTGWTRSFGNGNYDFWFIKVKINVSDAENNVLYIIFTLTVLCVAGLFMCIYAKKEAKSENSGF